MRARRPSICLLLLCVLGASAAAAQSSAERAALARLAEDSGGTARVQADPLTGTARFVRIAPGSLPFAGTTAGERSAEFLRQYGAAFGVTDPPRQLRALEATVDRYGHTRVDFEQRHRGLPVFAGTLRAHIDPAGRLVAVNGSFVPRIDVETTPVLSPAEAASIAIAAVASDADTAIGRPLFARSNELMVFRAGRLRGVEGRDHLVYLVEVTDISLAVREELFVDARTGKIVDRITGTHTALQRTVHEPDFNSAVVWSEGDTLPYSTGNSGNDAQVNDLISMSDVVYDFFLNLSGGTFASWNGVDGVMHTIWNASFINCPNASWNGSSTNYCDGTASDDVIAHEWGHAYTDATHDLIYQWQSGALNESYSDIFGELIDRLDAIGTDSPAPPRTEGDCSTYSGSPPPALEILSPPAIAGSRSVAGAAFNPPAPANARAPIELADDGFGDHRGCSALVGFTGGRIALLDRGICGFSDKVIAAQDAGAIGAIIVNYDDSVFSMGGSNGAITIPSVMISNSDGAALKAQLDGSSVGAEIDLAAASSNSLRWLIGEDAPAFGNAIRDMWNPTCKSDPDRVTSGFYQCSTADSGGVHSNSGVPNHAFALLVDGGTFNGQTIAALGEIKAAHVYWRAMTTYQVADSNFADHETALLQSCDDLLGVDLEDVQTGALSGQAITAADCDAVAAAMTAVEMSAAPPCNFQPLLAPDPPAPVCGAVALYDGFESPAAGWDLSNAGVFAEYSPRDWVRTTTVPEGGDGYAWFAIDSLNIGNCLAGDDDQSGAMSLDSPPIALGGVPTLSFDHYVATESRFDGGNLKISVNGGPFEPIAAADFLFNPYNTTLNAAPDNTCPLAGEEAFSGSDGGEIGGSWGQSQVSLAAHAGAGDTVRLRFEFGVDGCNGLDGWYVDNVLLCTDEQGAGSVPAGGGATPLTVRLGGGQLDLLWDASCASTDTDYEIYEGALGDFTSHEPVACSTGGATTAQIPDTAGDRYYLVVPRSASREGSYGTDGAGAERPPSAAACLPQARSYECF